MHDFSSALFSPPLSHAPHICVGAVREAEEIHREKKNVKNTGNFLLPSPHIFATWQK